LTTRDGDPRSERYGSVAIALHWAGAALVLANLLLGVSMVQLAISPRKLLWFQWHKWIGVTVFVVTALRFAWRARDPAPPLLAMPAWQARAATAVHVLLYALLVTVPVSGWLYSSASGVQVVYLGIVPLPDLVGADKALAAGLKGVHIALNATLFALVCLHVAAALKHHYVDRDRTLARMLPVRRGGGDAQ